MVSLIETLRSLANVRVLVVGDLMLDRFTYGKVERISPEAPVPVFQIREQKEMLGGAGNVVANLRALGCSVSVVGLVGRDTDGDRVERMLKECGAKPMLFRPADFPTIVKMRLIASGSHLSRVDRVEPLPCLDRELPRIANIVRRFVQQVDIVLLSDYGKGLLTEQTSPIIIDICRELGKQVIVDPKGADYTKYRGATLVKPNLKEFAQATAASLPDPRTPDFEPRLTDLALSLINRLNIANLIVTLGEHGMALISPQANPPFLRIPTQAKEVYDVSGAGDTSLAVLGAALGCGTPIEAAMRLANVASGLVVAKLGTATVTADEITRALSQSGTRSGSTVLPPERKIMTLDQAEQAVRNLRKAGKRIGFTNGAFDCCHMGHLRSFIATRKLCDVLVVALNSDACVRRLKGPSRPVQDEATRSLLLASMEFVDLVILFDEDTPMHIVERLRPDVLAKEGYTIDQWPEAQFAQSYGAQVVTLPRVEGYSTSNLVKKMK